MLRHVRAGHLRRTWRSPSRLVHGVRRGSALPRPSTTPAARRRTRSGCPEYSAPLHRGSSTAKYYLDFRSYETCHRALDRSTGVIQRRWPAARDWTDLGRHRLRTCDHVRLRVVRKHRVTRCDSVEAGLACRRYTSLAIPRVVHRGDRGRGCIAVLRLRGVLDFARLLTAVPAAAARQERPSSRCSRCRVTLRGQRVAGVVSLRTS